MEIIVGYCATCGSPVWADKENLYAPYETNCDCFLKGPILANPPPSDSKRENEDV